MRVHQCSRALGVAWVVGAMISASASPPTAAAPADVLADGGKAYRHWAAATPLDNNDWTGSTFMIGLMEYYKATVAAGATDASALAHAKAWAEHYDYKLKGPDHPHSNSPLEPERAQSSLPPGKHIADHQLCGATYIELYKIDRNEAHLADVKAVLGQEIAQSAATSNYWVRMIDKLREFACVRHLSPLLSARVELGRRTVHGYVYVLSIGQRDDGQQISIFGNREAVDELQRVSTRTSRRKEPRRCRGQRSNLRFLECLRSPLLSRRQLHFLACLLGSW